MVREVLHPLGAPGKRVFKWVVVALLIGATLFLIRASGRPAPSPKALRVAASLTKIEDVAPDPDGGLIAWRAGQAGLVGWVQSTRGCPKVLVEVTVSGQRMGLIDLGPMPASPNRTIWGVYLRDGNSMIDLDTEPDLMVSCDRWQYPDW